MLGIHDRRLGFRDSEELVVEGEGILQRAGSPHKVGPEQVVHRAAGQ